MNHHPYDRWLYQRDELQREQVQALEQHLESCEHCARLAVSLERVEAVITAAPMQAPQPGFVSRWRTRLHAERHKPSFMQKRVLTLSTISGALIIIGTLGYRLVVQLQDTLPSLLPPILRVFHLLTYLNLVREILDVIIDSFIQALPIAVRAGLPISFAVLLVFWIASIHRLNYSIARREL
jgi:hypothetical protein